MNYNRARDLYKLGSIESWDDVKELFWEKKREQTPKKYEKPWNYVTPESKKQVLKDLKENHRQLYASVLASELKVNNSNIKGGLTAAFDIADALHKKHGIPANASPYRLIDKAKDYSDRQFDYYHNEVLPKVHKADKRYINKHSFKIHTIEKAKALAKELIEANKNTPHKLLDTDFPELDLEPFVKDIDKYEENIKKERISHNLSEEKKIRDADFFRKRRNRMRVGLAAGVLGLGAYGIHKMINRPNQDNSNVDGNGYPRKI